ncbi:RNA polymerase II transcription mediator complex subunit 9-domain-containing protein [Scheffersomyces amazonensis]|uniref:RNA polymerase II transcription mediator complex subunit 9-domain-containing protein n=1 Tax=Scheffersomyces amazonensis TaxID=1078765 RepID=UPI00315C733A
MADESVNTPGIGSTSPLDMGIDDSMPTIKFSPQSPFPEVAPPANVQKESSIQPETEPTVIENNNTNNKDIKEEQEEDKIDDNVVEDEEEDEDDPIVKLQEIEILPDLFTLLHDLQIGSISAKDFDNNAGSIRLKLSNVRQYLSEIEGINETLKVREAKIDSLKVKNAKKYQFLSKFKSRVINEFEGDIDMTN